MQCAVLDQTMQPGTKKLLRFLQSWIINTVAVLVAVDDFAQPHQLRRQACETCWSPRLLLGILNAFVRPILMLIALPLLIFTLGLFTLVINALLLCLLSVLLPFFHVDSFRLRLSRRADHQRHFRRR